MSVATQTFNRTNFREFAFTRDFIRNKVIDHVFSHSPALAIFANQTLMDSPGATPGKGSGHATQSGGHSIIIRVTLGEHAGAARSAGPFGTHNINPDDNTRFAEANWKFYTHGLAVSEHDLRINKGESAISNFLNWQTTSVMRAAANLVADDIYSLTSPATAITSLPTLISANDSVQGLAGATYDNYNARGLSAVGTAVASISFASGSFASQGLADMRTLYNNASEGMYTPTTILTDYPTHERYEGVLQPQERFQGAVGTADGSFRALAFRTVPVLADRKCNSGYMYAVRPGEDGIQLVVLEGADFAFGEFKPAANQNVMVSPLELTCQLTICNRKYGNNKMTLITD